MLPLRRALLLVGALVVLLAMLVTWWPAGHAVDSTAPYDLQRLRRGWLASLREVAARGQVPMIDIESTYAPHLYRLDLLLKQLDHHGVALAALSPEMDDVDQPLLWDAECRLMVGTHPTRVIPTPTGDLHKVVAFQQSGEAFLAALFRVVERDHYPLLGEFFFRHYQSDVQFQRSSARMDIQIDLDGMLARQVYAFSQRTGLPVMVHIEFEHDLVERFEQVLDAYPGARVVWCHMGRARLPSERPYYTPELFEGLIARHPNLYFDVSNNSVVGEYLNYGNPCMIYDTATCRLKPGWAALFKRYPWRFLAALDMGSDRVHQIETEALVMRRLLSELPEPERSIISWRAAWKLLFREEVAL